MLDTVASLIDYLSEQLKVPRNRFDIYDSKGELALLECHLKDLLKEFCIDVPNVVKGIVRNPNSNSTLPEVESFVNEHCNLPDGCFKFYKSGHNTHFSSMQNN